ncbi:MAG: hypothetical protein BWY82_01500 [Verrucomicrobia bacterium ADurb.Bin474]|nr:MAG: hypothetical protein BWY82_01500 [Verrucomicrobia bacterium ADurb.Bin474]
MWLEGEQDAVGALNNVERNLGKQRDVGKTVGEKPTAIQAAYQERHGFHLLRACL